MRLKEDLLKIYYSMENDFDNRKWGKLLVKIIFVDVVMACMLVCLCGLAKLRNGHKFIIIMEYMHVVKAILKKDAVFREIHASVHVGMFQDSVLITDWIEGEVDFRYFTNHMMVVLVYNYGHGKLNIL